MLKKGGGVSRGRSGLGGGETDWEHTHTLHHAYDRTCSLRSYLSHLNSLRRVIVFQHKAGL